MATSTTTHAARDWEHWEQSNTLFINQSGGPPDLPIAVTVLFDNYRGPTLYDNTVLIRVDT